MQSDVREQDAIDRGIEIGLARGIERGIEQGIEQKAIDVARNLLTMGILVDDVAKATGLSVVELQSLI